MINKIIYSKQLNELNDFIVQYNKSGWVVKHIFVFGDSGWLGRASGYYALLEKDSSWK